MRKGHQTRNSAGNVVLADPRTHRYYLALNDQENEKFLAMFRQTQYRSAADFIRARIFDWPFRVVVRDKNTHDFLVRLTDFYSQFRMLGNNYNQITKAIHTAYGEKKALAFLYKGAAEMQKIVQLLQQVIALAGELRERLRQPRETPENSQGNANK